MEIEEQYMEWLLRFVSSKKYCPKGTYSNLLMYLRESEFKWSYPMDENRASDGIALRYRFGDENDIPQPEIAYYLDNRGCSMLEMMIALSIRIENDIMWNPDKGDRIAKWFWQMINSLGLKNQDDANFDIQYTSAILERFYKHAYDLNGKGGLFTINHTNCDMRNLEIWTQMNQFLIAMEPIDI